MSQAAKMITGQRYGRLVVIERAGSDREGKSLWRFKCDCGNETTITAKSAKSGNTTSCGCRRRETLKELPIRSYKHGNNRRGQRASEYTIWSSMKSRCHNPNDNDFYLYGARGIAVCDRWQQFENFYADMGPRPPALTLDRINNDGNYEPSNCRWATAKEQRHNRRRSIASSVVERSGS